MDTVQTVKIARPDLPGGYLVINAVDFDPATMALYSDKPAETEQATEPKRRRTK